MKQRCTLVVATAALVALAAVVFPTLPAAQTEGSALISFPRPNLVTTKWFGPFGITPNDTARFNYSNLGTDSTSILWAFTNAQTGEIVCSNIGKPTMVRPGTGVQWDYSQTVEPNGEVRHCDDGVGAEIEPGETYFDATNRHQLLAWLFITHLNAQAMRRAVDLPDLELFDSFKAKLPGGPAQGSTFGRTLAVIDANPVAPLDWQVPKVFGQ